MKLIEVNTAGSTSDRIWINVDNIISMRVNTFSEETQILFQGAMIAVKETPDEIMQLASVH